jgi:GTP-sensing pleiotropic transcriptional regulator CodY
MVQAATRGIANDIAELALEQPVLTAAVVEVRLGVSRQGAIKALRQLEDGGP